MIEKYEGKALQRIERPIIPEASHRPSLPSLKPNLGEVLDDLGERKGIKAWWKTQQVIASRKRASAVIDAEIMSAKKRIEYIRTAAEESSVVDEERLRIAKIRQEMDRLELQDQVERKRLEKELEELERDIRVLRMQPQKPADPPKSLTAEEKRQETIKREKEKHEFDIEMKKLRAEQGLAARQALTAAKNEKIAQIRRSYDYTDEQKQQLIEDVEDYYDNLLDRTD